MQSPRYGSSLLSPDYEALQAEEILNSDGGASICFKQSCPQPCNRGSTTGCRAVVFAYADRARDTGFREGLWRCAAIFR